MNWHFRTIRRGDDIADPISGEFFADGSLENPAAGLVREAIQNALDAGRGASRNGPVRVAIGLYRGDHAASAEAVRPWFKDLWPHLEASGNGLKSVPGRDEPCDYLTVEDFGTTGLTGDFTGDGVEDEQNNFVDFLRSDGRTRKGGGARGSWGVGKNVFPRASRINGFLACTVRHDDRLRLLMGKCILKSRIVAGQRYQPPCYFCRSWDANDVPRPFEDDEPVDRLKRTFRIRRDRESGLSLVIPWVDRDISYNDLLSATISHYAVAILSDSLAVTLTDGDQELSLDHQNLLRVAHERVPNRAASVELAHWALTEGVRNSLLLEAPDPQRPQKWTPELVPAEVRTEVRRRLQARERVAVRVPVHVRKAGDRKATRCCFLVFLEHDDSPRVLRPEFFREQLSISGVKRAVGAPGVRSLVFIDDAPLANLLRDAEPPNHTDWDPKTANFRQVYRDGNYVITFVKEAVKQVMAAARADDESPDASIAIDFFSVRSEETDVRTPRGGRPRGGGTVPPVTPQQTSPDRFRIRQVEGGFQIGPGDPAVVPPRRLRVVVAYDVESGSPWKQYEREDFDFFHPRRHGIEIIPAHGTRVTVLASNRLELLREGPEFGVRVTGFDGNRDLIVRAYDPRGVVDVDQTAELHEEAQAHAG